VFDISIQPHMTAAEARDELQALLNANRSFVRFEESPTAMTLRLSDRFFNMALSRPVAVETVQRFLRMMGTALAGQNLCVTQFYDADRMEQVVTITSFSQTT
jgi:hypothetical protein